MAEYDAGGYEYGEEDYGEGDESITPEDSWRVISSYFSKKSLVSQQIDSFDEFTTTTVQSLIDEHSLMNLDQTILPDMPASVKLRRYEIKLGGVLVSKPTINEQDGQQSTLIPYECRDRNLTYSCPLYVRINKKVSLAVEEPVPLDELDEEQRDEIRRTGEQPTRIRWDEEATDPAIMGDSRDKNQEAMKDMMFIGKLPIMVKSKICHLAKQDEDNLFMLNECPYDQGGYFIINGSEKVLIAQERSAANIVQVFKKGQPSKYSYMAEIRSALDKGSRLISNLAIMLTTKGDASKGSYGATVQGSLPLIKGDLPIAIVFRALGVVSDEDILNHICYDRNDSQMLEMLRPCIEEAFCIQDREVALDYIGKRAKDTQGVSRRDRVRAARETLQKEVLPHIAQTEGCEARKAFFLGYMVHKLLQCALGRRDVDDRDHFGKKRLDLAGPLLAKLFRNLIRKMTNELMGYLKRCIDQNKQFDIRVGMRHQSMTSGLKYSLATGNWGDQKKAMSTVAGVSQVLNRYTFASTLSHLRRTNTPIGRDGKLAKPRQLHNTHWGLVCPAETPEGQACGLVKNLSLMCYVSVGTPADPIVDFMVARNMEVLEEYEPLRYPNATKVFVNGTWVGVHQDPKHLVRLVQGLRRKGIIQGEVSLVRDIRDREFKIFSDAGRVMRPLFAVEQEENAESGVEKGALILTKDHIARLEQDEAIGQHHPDYWGWDGLQEVGAIEYLDAEEEETSMICMTPEDLENYRLQKAGKLIHEEVPDDDPNRRLKTKLNPTTHMYTHCEIHPSMLLGICASIIPFPDHNQVCSMRILSRGRS